MASRWMTLGVTPPPRGSVDRATAARFVRDMNARMLLIALLAAIPIVLILGSFGAILIAIVLILGVLDVAYLSWKLGRVPERHT